MEIEDKIYGRKDVNELVLIELINCPSLQRLKDVSQLGMPDKYYHRRGYSRYEHSLGVFVLLGKLGATLEEQIAGLLHDVSHTAFSHVVDWVVGDPTKEDYQDKNHLNALKNSEIPGILDKRGFDFKRISKLEDFSLLEREVPSLCADRIDYTFREMYHTGKEDLVKRSLSNLKNFYGQVVFLNKKIATSFAEEYMELQIKHWAGEQARARYFLLSDALKRGMKKKILCFDDLNKTETYILDILENSKDKYILEKLNLLKKGFSVVESDEGIELKKKFRYIDPEVLINGSYKKLSELSKNYKEMIEREKENSRFIKKIKIIPNENPNVL